MRDEVKNVWKISPWRKVLMLTACFAGGTLYAAALPPLNWSFAVMVSLVPVLYCAGKCSWKFSALCGWVWGLGWALFAYQFLREIEWFVPYLLAPVIALWSAVWAALLPGIYRTALLPQSLAAATCAERGAYLKNALPQWRILLAAVVSAAAFTMVEWTRSRLFVWNDFSVTQWRNTVLIQIAALTGSYGIGFLLALINAAVYTAAVYRKKAVATVVFSLVLTGAALLYGCWRIKYLSALPPPVTTVRAGLIQCDLTQRRSASSCEVYEAVDVCTSLSEKCAALKPEFIIWPESAVPIPLQSGGAEGDYFRRRFAAMLRKTKLPFLAGMLAFKQSSASDEWKITNSAVLFTPGGRAVARYDKIHRVPYGEYVPFRKYLPEFIINAVNMGRDLEPGVDFDPVPLKPNVNASIAICYEGVFGYLMREFARRGADLFITISNDAWYPRSSEPEQHLANAAIRCVETGLFMIRCGNHGGSGVVTPLGKFTQYIGSRSARPELLRERAYGVVEVPVYADRQATVFVRCGEYFIAILAVLLTVFAVYALLYSININARMFKLVGKEEK